ncbi:MAG TPA: autotransporter-associated beta strand repeat-containing protein [Polymorphobacter sp.]|nr:autotransporter-associated beta strand repeat-containing protein [Polymorphobacter sp.]
MPCRNCAARVPRPSPTRFDALQHKRKSTGIAPITAQTRTKTVVLELGKIQRFQQKWTKIRVAICRRLGKAERVLMGYTCLRGTKMTASRSNAAPVVLANRRVMNGFRRHGGSLTALLLGSAVLLSPMAAHAQALDLLGTSQSVDHRNGGGDVTNSGPGAATLTFTTSTFGTHNMNGDILETDLARQISIVMAGLPGLQQHLHGHSTYTGGTTITSGILGFGFGDSFGFGLVTLNGGEMLATGSGLNLANNIDVTANSTIVVNSTTLSGQITGAAPFTITKNGSSILTLTGDNSGFNGGFNVNGGSGFGTVFVGTTNALGSSLATFTSTTAGRISVAAGVTNATLANNFNLGGTLTIVAAATDSIALTGDITSSSGINLGTTSTTNMGTVYLSGNNAGFTGTLWVIDTATVGVGSNSALGTQAVQIKEDATLLAMVGGLTIANGLTVGGAGGDRFLTVDTNGNDLTLNGPINNSTAANKGGLVKVGAGTLFLTNTAGTYSQGTQINGGAISVSTGAALGVGGTALGFDGGTLQVTGTSFNTTNRPITLNAGGGGFDVADASNIFDLTAIIGGSGGLTKLGAGTLQLSAANVFTGSSTVSAGTLALANSDGFGTGGLVTLAGGTLQANAANLDLALDVTLAGGTIDTNGNTFTLSGAIDGSADLVKNGAGVLVLAGVGNSYGGGGAGTYLNAGEIEIRDDTSFGNGSVFMADGTSIIAGANNLVVANNIYLGNPSAIDTGANTLTITGALHDNSGGAVLDKEGSGTLILTNGSNDYTGGTHLNVGTLNIGHNLALGTAAIIAAGGTSLGGASAAVYTIANALTLDGNVTVGDNATSFVMNGDIDGVGTLTKGDGGFLQLGGNNSYTGGTVLNNGAASVNQNSGFGTGTVTMRAVFPNPKRELLPGMYVRAVIEQGVRDQSLVVPQQGVAHDPQGNAVAMVVNAEGKVESRPLKTERAIGNQWLVSEGLQTGDKLIVEGLQKARPGSPVTAVPAGSKAPAAQGGAANAPADKAAAEKK